MQSFFVFISSTGTFGVNAVIVIALGIAWDLVKQKEPPQTGFFCHDATLTKPYVSARVRKLTYTLISERCSIL